MVVIRRVAPFLLAGNGLLIPLESAGPLGGPPPGVTPYPPLATDWICAC